MSNRITVKNIRIVYPNLAVKGTYEGEEKDKYDADFIVPKDHPQIDDLKAMIEEQKDALKEKSPKEKFAFNAGIQALVDGDGITGNGVVIYKDAYRLRGKSPNPVPCFDKYKNKLDQENGAIASGDYVSAQFTFWSTHKMKGIVGANLLAVVHKSKGEPIGGAQADLDDFDDFVDAEDDLDELDAI